MFYIGVMRIWESSKLRLPFFRGAYDKGYKGKPFFGNSHVENQKSRKHSKDPPKGKPSYALTRMILRKHRYRLPSYPKKGPMKPTAPVKASHGDLHVNLREDAQCILGLYIEVILG